MINFFILIAVLVLTIGMIYLLNLKFNILKYLIKRKISFIFLSLLAAFLISLFVQFYENIYRLDNYWINKNGYLLEIIEDKEIISKDEKVLQKYLKDFKPSPEENEKWNCYKNFVSKDVNFEMFDIVINSVRILQFSSIDNTCYKNTSKVFMDISYILVIVGLSFAIFSLLYKRLNLIIRKKNHSVVIGLNNNSRELISKLIAKKENIKIYDNDNTNKYINELENSGEIIITGKLEYTIESNNCEIINAKEIYIINDSDVESLNNLALLLSKFDNYEIKIKNRIKIYVKSLNKLVSISTKFKKYENIRINNRKKIYVKFLNKLALILSKFKHEDRKSKDKTKIYIEIKNRENKALFDKKGIYNLISDYYEIYPFSINEIIVQEMFKDKKLISNIKNKNGKYVENLKILIVGFNDLSEEILFNILKLGHFDLNKITEVTVIDDKYELLNCKYKTIIERGKKPYENSDESLWNIEFLPYKSLYENRVFNRIILCDKELNNGLDILNYMNNNYHIQIREKNTIIQVFNEHKNINNTINRDENNFKNFSTFGDIETTVTLDNINNNNLYKVAEYTNDFKETDESKKWKKIDNFTRESNITEKLHMNIKLDIFNLHICNFLKTQSQSDLDVKLLESYYKNNIKILKKHLNEAIKLPYSLEILSKLYSCFLEKNFNKYSELKKLEKEIKDLKSEIEKLDEKLREVKKSELKELEKKLKELEIDAKNSLKDKNFYNEVNEKLVFNLEKSNSDNMEVIMAISLANFYLKVKDNTNYVEFINNLAQIEHTRWNAYHILNGWIRRKITDKDMLKKEHYDLCDWETLKKDDPGVVKYDYKNIYQIPFVAYCLGNSGN
ncbi:transcriptional regulator [Arcobacter caeni]|uniref:Uncharacterized protein n=1 Tax=Arcobacter caeni TaxID=1912877 RepID=A0A363D5P7_9BACT|nr:hypothetical protein [Arcobacter caeni]PUE66622.1 hypothetical protein B0174_00800 [Arcobacter caeni]